MFSYPLDKYNFYIAKRINGEPYKVVAVSSYEGRPVRGIAKVDPRDTFDLEKGKELAAARCNAKIAKRRLKRAEREYTKAFNAEREATIRLGSMIEYVNDARAAVDNAAEVLAKLRYEM